MCSSCFLVLVAVDGNGWRFQVFRQVMDVQVHRAEPHNWTDNVHHKEQSKLERNKAAENSKIQVKSVWGVNICFKTSFSSG